MRAVIVTGDRNAQSSEWGRVVYDAIGNTTLVVIHGAAPGIDSIANQICTDRGPNVVAVPARWDMRGRDGGPFRNRQMLIILSILRESGYDVDVLAFHDDLPNSKGTGHMVRIAREAGIPVRHFTSDGTEHTL